MDKIIPYMHVNYLEGISPLDKIFRLAAGFGYAGVEVRDRDRSGKKPHAIMTTKAEEGNFVGSPLSRGNINNYLLIKQLFEQGYSGAWCLENVSRGDKFDLATEDIRYFHGVCRRIT